MSKGKSVTTFYFDVISPYSWIGFESFLRYEKILPTTIQFKPFFLGGIMQGSGNKPPAVIPNKGAYMMKDLEYNSRYWGMKIKPPSDFVETVLKRGSLQAQRFLTVLDLEKPEYLRPAALEFSNRVWSRDEPIHELANIKELKIPDSDKLIAEIGSQRVKDTLKKNTDDALATGSFGAPWIVLKKEDGSQHVFFGSDRLPLFCHEFNTEYRGPLKSKL